MNTCEIHGAEKCPTCSPRKKILILGGTGMLGHQLVESLHTKHKVHVGARIDLEEPRIVELLAWSKPEVVINCIGIVKQRQAPPEEFIEVNSLFPHRLARVCRTAGARLIHFSTDCVFNGKAGNYSEQSTPNPEDLYGRSKLLGEVEGPGYLTLRTSIIGRELNRKQGLVEWFLSQRGAVKGYAHHSFTGLTTLEVARVVDRIITHFPNASGIRHVGGDPITKYGLLLMLKRHYNLPVEVTYDLDSACDRTLNSAQFRYEFQYKPPTWASMIAELAKECPLVS